MTTSTLHFDWSSGFRFTSRNSSYSRERAADAARAVREVEAAERAAAEKVKSVRHEIADAFAVSDPERADRLRAELREIENELHRERSAGARLAAERASRAVSAFAGEHLEQLLAERAEVAEQVRADLADALVAVVSGVSAWNAAAQEATSLLQLAGRAAELRVASLPFQIEQIDREVRRANEPIPAPMPAVAATGTLKEFRASEPALCVDDPAAGEPVVALPDLRGSE